MLKNLSKNVKITLSILLLFIGLCLFSFTYFKTIKEDVYNKKNMDLMEEQIVLEDIVEEINEPVEVITTETKKENDSNNKIETFTGILEVPDAGLKRGFFDIKSKYNNVKYNIQVIEGSQYPDQENGNLILAAHSGNSSISFFKNLYKLNNGAYAHVTFANKKFTYKLVNIYEEPKDGVVTISRNGSKRCLTLITCTKGNNSTQTIYVFELESIN